MPHLSPLNWLLAPIIFWSILIMFSSILWWSQIIMFPKMSSSLLQPSTPLWGW
uniref:ATP synthase F0 subunit 8 n=2 Tax=Branchipolynoe TaxID=167792 RepID=A0A343W652_9ANNE|nr:ATP synthase F0 subunit 8 [Branchipolynoe pettiboneae]AVW86074.1 ATP synthase F0 subunit 8 [Branchipolynoe sp. YZ-2018]